VKHCGFEQSPKPILELPSITFDVRLLEEVRMVAADSHGGMEHLDCEPLLAASLISCCVNDADQVPMGNDVEDITAPLLLQ
jgi:hypothetical protein